MMQMQQQQPQGYHHPQTLEEVRTLWIGDLQYWVDENYLTSCFSQTGELVSVKVIRNKITGQPEGYGFIEFVSHAAAERTLQTYNGTPMPGTEIPFRLNWASFGSGQKVDAGPDHSIFVGDLAPDVTDYLLQETFRVHYSSVRGAKVVTDPSTGRSKGYGFVKFAEESERNRAMSEMNGLYCSTRPMRISVATPKKNMGVQQQYVTKSVYPVPVPVPSAVAVPVPTYVAQPGQVLPPESDVTCTTISIANLDPNATEEDLKKAFSQLGEIIYVNIPPTKGYGFVQFKTRPSAEEAVTKMQGHVIGQQAVRISWSKNPGQDGWAAQADPNQWSGYYGYGQGYDAYAYGTTQDPSLYAYGGYSHPQYPQQGDGAQEITNSGVVAVGEQELYDPLATPDVDKLNASYASVHASAILGRPLWQRTSALISQLGK